MVDAATRFGYDGVDLRVEWGHRHGLELDSSQEARRDARQYAAAQGITISCVALSTRLARTSDVERNEMVEQARRYAELASDLGSPFLRVFGGRIPEGHTMAELRPSTAEALGRAAEACAQWGVTPCLEVHDEHNDPADVAWIVEHAGHGNVGVVWHVWHHVRRDISVDDAYARLRPWVRHLHSGRGDPVPLSNDDSYLARAFELLERDGFEGFAANEWIIKRNADYDPEQGLPQAYGMLDAWRQEARQKAGRA
jgi:sugar phosphate isomerase/epimerase